MKNKLLFLFGIMACWITNPIAHAQSSCALKGTYTIDATQPSGGNNFTSFTEAAQRLDTCGVSGNVVINVAAGIYNEEFRIGKVEGASDTSGIIIQATGAVEINYASTGSAVVHFDSVSFLTFRGFVVNDLDSGSLRSFYISGISKNVTIEDNELSSLFTSSSSMDRISNLTIRNNTVHKTLFILGEPTDYFSSDVYSHSDVTIEGNTIAEGIVIDSHNRPQILDNIINGGGIIIYDLQYLEVGISLTDISVPFVSSNNININSGERNAGIHVDKVLGSNNDRGLIVNNMVNMQGAAIFGLNVLQGYYLDIFYNTVRVNSSDLSAIVANFTLPYGAANSGRDPYGNTRVINNILVNENGGLVLSIDENLSPTEYISEMDFNDYYTTGSKFGVFAEDTVSDLVNWQHISRKDPSSISVDPSFVSSQDLHVSSLNLLSGKPIPGIDRDIDDQSRAVVPTIGASELLQFDGNCSSFTGFTIDSLKDDRFKLNWLPGSNSTSFYLEYGQSGFTPGSSSGTLITGTYPGSEPPLYITGLSAETEYDIYFGEICNSGNDTAKVEKLTLTTPGVCPIIRNAILSYAGTDSVFFELQSFNEEFNIEWGPVGYEQGTGSAQTSGSTFGINGLSVNTSYDMYIQTNCSSEANGASPWYGPVKFSTACEGSLSGNYTIGGTSGPRNFENFREAAAALNNCGVSGPVVVNVVGKPGNPYEEQFTLKDIPGISAQNTVTIQGQSPVTNPAELRYAPFDQENNYVIHLEDASYITIKDLKITVDDQAGYSRAIIFSGEGHHISIEGNTIEGSDGITQLVDASLLYFVQASRYNHCVVRNNIFRKGASAITLYAYAYERSKGNVIEYNTMEDFQGVGMWIQQQDSVTIHKNILTPSGTSAILDMTGMNVVEGTHVTITGNTIRGPVLSSFIMFGMMIVSNNSCLVANNMVSIAPNLLAGGIGMLMQNNQNLDVIHNSIFNPSPGMGGESRALHFFHNSSYSGAGPSNTRVLNNSLVGINGVLAIEVEEGAVESIIESDHNNLYATGEVLGIWGNSTAIDLADWQSISGEDTNSVSGDPLYVSSDDLHVQSILLNDKGKPVTSVTEDIDEENRSATNPDIGADEFVPSGCFSSINFKALAVYSDSVHLNWQPGSGAGFHIQYDTANFTLGNGNRIRGISDTVMMITGLSPQTTYDFYLMDSCTAIDTSIWVGPITYTTPCTNSNLLAGVYTIDSSRATAGRNFASFSEVAAVLNECGIRDSVVFNVVEGVYNEQVNLEDVYGISSENTITFQPDPSNTGEAMLFFGGGNTHNYTFQFTNISYVTIRGLHLSADTTAATYGSVIRFTGTSNHISIENNKITGLRSTLSMSDQNQAVIVNAGNKLDRINQITIRDNKIYNGSNSIYWYGGNGVDSEYGSLIENNLISGFSAKGIRADYQDSLSIHGNTIEGLQGAGNIFLRNTSYFKISSNKLYGSGLETIACNSDAQTPGIIANNMISSGTEAGVIAYGEYMDVVYNSISSRGSCLNITFISNHIKVFNNNLFNIGSGFTLSTSATNITNFVMDYNNHYPPGNIDSPHSQGANSISVDPLFVSPGTLYAASPLLNNKGTFISWITTDIDGVLRSPTTPDIGANEFSPKADDIMVLAISKPQDSICGDSNTTVSLIIANVGTQDAGGFNVYADISGSVNNSLSQVYSGALLSGKTDTISLSSFNSVSADTVNIKAYINYSGDQNNENDTLYKTLYFQPSSLLIPGVAKEMFCASEPYDTLYFPQGIESELVWLTTSGDTISKRDSLVAGPFNSSDTTFILSALEGCYRDGRVRITVSESPEAAFTTVLQSPEMTKLTVDLDAGTSKGGDDFQWDFGDGNTGFGEVVSHDYTSNGSYEVQLIVKGSCGSDTLTKTLTISGISLEENSMLQRSLEVYPNPATDKVNISFETQSSEGAEIQLMDLSGKVIRMERAEDINGKYRGKINLENLSRGTYMIRIQSGDIQAVKRIVKTGS